MVPQYTLHNTSPFNYSFEFKRVSLATDVERLHIIVDFPQVDRFQRSLSSPGHGYNNVDVFKHFVVLAAVSGNRVAFWAVDVVMIDVSEEIENEVKF